MALFHNWNLHTKQRSWMLSNPIFGPLTLLCIQNCWLPGSPKKIGCGFRWRFAIVCFCMCSAFF